MLPETTYSQRRRWEVQFKDSCHCRDGWAEHLAYGKCPCGSRGGSFSHVSKSVDFRQTPDVELFALRPPSCCHLQERALPGTRICKSSAGHVASVLDGYGYLTPRKRVSAASVSLKPVSIMLMHSAEDVLCCLHGQFAEASVLTGSSDTLYDPYYGNWNCSQILRQEKDGYHFRWKWFVLALFSALMNWLQAS